MGCATASVAEPAYQHHVKLTPENSAIGNYPAQKKPVLTVQSGATVRIDGGGGNRWRDQDPLQWAREQGITLTPEQTQAMQETARVIKEATYYAGITSGHLLVGPIAVAGAMPGDAIEIRILSVNNDLSDQASVLISLVILHSHVFAKDKIGKVLFRARAKRLVRLRRIDA